MVEGEVSKADIKQHEKTIDAAVADSLIQENEAPKVDEAATFLNKEKTNDKLKDKIGKIFYKYKNKILEGINNYLKNTDNMGKITELAQITSYRKLLTTFADVGNYKDIQQGLNSREIAIKGIETTEKEKSGKEKLQDVLNVVKPDKELANKFFGEDETYRAARDALFDTNNMSQTITTPPVAGSQEEKLRNIIAVYAGKESKDIASITLSKSGTSTEYKENFINVKLVNGGYKDILFTKTTDGNYQKRAETFDIEKDWNKGKTISENIKEIDKKGSYRSFEKVIKDPTKVNIKELLTKDSSLFENIQTLHTEASIDDKLTKENGYYSIITDYVVRETSKVLPDITLLQAYLKNINIQNIRYLGTDKKTQIENYNKLVDLVDSTKNPNFPKESDSGKEAMKNILDLQKTLQNVQSRREALDKGVDGFFKAFGKELVGILELFGGKGCVKKFFSALGMDAFYEKNLKAIEENINKIYKEKFELSKTQKDGIEEVIGGKNAEKFSTTEFPIDKSIEGNNGEIVKMIDTKIDAFKNSSKTKDASANKTVFAESIQKKDYISMLDPTLVHYLMTKTFDKRNGDGLDNDDGKPVNDTDLNNFVYKDVNTNERKISDKLKDEKGKENQSKLIARLLADQATRDAIKGANAKITGVDPDLTDKKAEITRPDLINRQLYTIQSEQDIARYLTAYAFAGSKSLDYVITESDTLNSKNAVDRKSTSKTTPEATETANEIKDYVDGEYLDKDGALKDVEPISIDKIFLDYDKAPNNLLITPKGKQEAIKIKKGTIKGIKTYVYEEGGTRAIIHDGDKISIPEEAIKGDGKEEKEKKTNTDNNQTGTQNISGAVVNTPENKDKTANQTKEENNNQTNTPQGTSNTGKNDNSTTTEEVTFTAPVNNVVAANNQINSTENNSTESPDKKRQEQIIGAYRNVTDTYQKIAPKKVENIVSTVNDDNVTGKERSLMTDMYNNTKPKETGNIQDTNNTPPTGKQVVVGPTIGQSIINDMLTKKQNTATVVDATPTATVNSQANNTQDKPIKMNSKEAGNLATQETSNQVIPAPETIKPQKNNNAPSETRKSYDEKDNNNRAELRKSMKDYPIENIINKEELRSKISISQDALNKIKERDMTLIYPLQEDKKENMTGVVIALPKGELPIESDKLKNITGNFEGGILKLEITSIDKVSAKEVTTKIDVTADGSEASVRTDKEPEKNYTRATNGTRWDIQENKSSLPYGYNRYQPETNVT